MSVAVVAWHGHVFGTSALFRKGFPMPHSVGASDVINFNVLLLAVPTFITIECFLYGRDPDAPDALSKRVRRIGLLLCVWPITLLLFQGGYAGLVQRVANVEGWE